MKQLLRKNSDLPAGVQFSRLRTIQSSVSDLAQFRPDAKGKQHALPSYHLRFGSGTQRTPSLYGVFLLPMPSVRYYETLPLGYDMKVYLENQVVKPSDRGDIGSY